MTLGYYETSISAGCSGYVNSSNSAILKHRPGHSVILPAKPSVVLGPSALPKQFPGVGLAVHMGQGPFATDRLNGSVLHSKVRELQSIFPWAIWFWDQRTLPGTFNVLLLQSTSKSLQEGKPTSTARGVRKCDALSSPTCLQSCVMFTDDLCWNMQITLGYSTIPIISIVWDPYKEAVSEAELTTNNTQKKSFFSPSLSGLSCR